MPYTFADAKIEVARTIGGQNDEDELLAAGIAINKAIRMWNREHTWDFMRFDNLSDQEIPSLTTIASPTVTLPTGVSYPNFSSVYIGTLVSGAGIPDDTTVIAKNSDSSLTLSADATASADPVTLTFSGPIPVIVEQRDYALPFAMAKPSYAKLVAAGRALMYVRSRFVNHTTDPESAYDGTWGYTYMPIQGSSNAQGILPLPTTKVRLYATPDVGDTLILEGFRQIQTFLNDLTANDEARQLDVPDLFQDDLLELATYFYQNNKDSENTRAQDKKQNAAYFLRRAIRRDLAMDDEEVRFYGPDEMLMPAVRRRDPWGW